MARKAKYSEEWRSRAAALQAKIEEAMALASASIGDYGWLHLVKYPSPEKKSGSVRSSRHKGSASHFRCVWRRRSHEATTS